MTRTAPRTLLLLAGVLPLLLAGCTRGTAAASAQASQPAQEAETGGQDCADAEIRPASPAVGAEVPESYFGPGPTEPGLVGPQQLIRSGPVDLCAGTVTLPLYEGEGPDGEPVWYVVTDTSREETAEILGINFSDKLNYVVGSAIRTATQTIDGRLVFDQGSVDFAPEVSAAPGTDDPEKAFPLAEGFQPGSVGDDAYTPIVRVTNDADVVFNAPILAQGFTADELNYCDGDPDHSRVHDKVVRFCPEDETVTLTMTPGFSFARPVQYLSLDANDAQAAVLEGATLAPGLAPRDLVGRDDSFLSSVERLFVARNGPLGGDNPFRQGLNTAILGEGNGPINVFGGIPTIANDYSPLWDLNLFEWTPEAIDQGYRTRLIEEFQILRLVRDGVLTGPDGGAFGSTGIIVNCPVVFRYL